MSMKTLGACCIGMFFVLLLVRAADDLVVGLRAFEGTGGRGKAQKIYSDHCAPLFAVRVRSASQPKGLLTEWDVHCSTT